MKKHLKRFKRTGIGRSRRGMAGAALCTVLCAALCAASCIFTAPPAMAAACGSKAAPSAYESGDKAAAPSAYESGGMAVPSAYESRQLLTVRPVWENPYFAIDGEQLYDAMTAPASDQGVIMPGPRGSTVYIPLIYLPADSAVAEDTIKVILEFPPEASLSLNTLRYELTAKKTAARTDQSVSAWLVMWKPDFSDNVLGQTVKGRMHIKANQTGSGGSSVLKTDGFISVIFREDTLPEESETAETEGSGTGEPESGSIKESESESIKESESESIGEPESESIKESESESIGESESESDKESQTDESSERESQSDQDSETNPPGDDSQTPDDNSGGSDGTGGDVPITWGSDGSGGGGEASPAAPPKLRITGCTVDSGEIHPGDTVSIAVALKNSSSQTGIKDIRIVYESATGEVLPVNATNSIYIDSIGAAGSYSIEFPVEVGYSLSSDTQKIVLTMEYTDKDAASHTSTENIFLKITPAFDLRIDQPSMAPSVESGSAQDITVNVYNTGGSPVKNVICSLTMEGVQSAGSAFGGDVAAGENVSIVLHTLIGKLSSEGSSAAVDSGSSAVDSGGSGASPDREAVSGAGASDSGASSGGYGQTTGTVVVRYEDEEGNMYSQEAYVTTQIVPPEGAEAPKEVVEKSSQWWVSIVCGLVVIQVVIFILIGVHRRRSV